MNYLDPKYKYQKPIIKETKQKRKNKTITISKIDFEPNFQCVKFSIIELFKQQYPSLNYYKDYFNPLGTDKIFSIIKKLIDSDIDFCIKVQPILFSYASKNKDSIKKLERENKELILKMKEYRLIHSVNELEKGISIFGLLLLLYVLYYNLDFKNTIAPNKLKEYPNEREAKKKIQEVIRNNKKLLPYVFTRWDKLQKICNDDEKLFHALLMPFVLSFEKLIKLSIDSPKMRILIDQYYIERDYLSKLNEIYDSGLNMGFDKWHTLDFFIIDDYSTNELFSIQNVISFYFYSQIKAYFSDNSKVQKFLEEDEEIHNWWNQWINVITKYNIESRESLILKEPMEVIK